MAGGEIIELCRFHFDAKDAVACHLFVEIRALVIKHIRAVDAAHMGGGAFGGGRICGGAQQAVIGAGGKVDLFEDATGGGGQRGCCHGDDHIAHFHAFLHAATGADADQGLCAIVFHQLIGVDRKGGHAHAGAVDGDAVAVPHAGEAKHAAHFVDKFHILQEGFGGPFCAIGIAGQKHGFSDVTGLGTNMHGHLSILSSKRGHESRRSSIP